jgi:hypothetical protein
MLLVANVIGDVWSNSRPNVIGHVWPNNRPNVIGYLWPNNRPNVIGYVWPNNRPNSKTPNRLINCLLGISPASEY